MITLKQRRLVKPSEKILDLPSTTLTEIFPTPNKTKKQATPNSSSVDLDSDHILYLNPLHHKTIKFTLIKEDF